VAAHRGIAAINSVIPFALFAWGASGRRGIGAISNAMTVMFTALIAFLFYVSRSAAAPHRLVPDSWVWPFSPAQDRRCECLPRRWRHDRGAAVWHRHQPGAPLSHRLPRRRGGGRQPRERSVLLAPLAIYTWPHHAIAPPPGQRRPARRAVHRNSVRVYYRLIAASAPRTSTVTT